MDPDCVSSEREDQQGGENVLLLDDEEVHSDC